jgi:hypothetical protein
MNKTSTDHEEEITRAEYASFLEGDYIFLKEFKS